MHMTRTASISIITLYWSAVALGSFALLISMVTTLWGPRTPSPQASLAERRTWCVGQLALLSEELEHETQAALGPYIKATDASLKRRERWQRGWGERLGHVDGQCQKPETLHQALGQLSLLAQRYDAIVVSWQGAQDNLHTPIQTALKGLVDPWAQADSDAAKAP